MFKKIGLMFLVALMVLTSLACVVEAKPAAKKKKTDLQLVKEVCKKNYKGKKIKIVEVNKLTSKQLAKITEHRKGKKYVVVEKFVTISIGNIHGACYAKDVLYSIIYNKKVRKGKKIIAYRILDPFSNRHVVTYTINNGKVVKK